MRLGLLRHATAEPPREDDFGRRLTRGGERELDAMLDALAAAGWQPGLILFSPAVRTWQTAEAVHRRFPSVAMEACDALWQGNTEGIFRAASGRPDPVLVGHEPTMGRLCARLIGAPLDAMPFERAGFALLEVDRLPSTAPARLVTYLSPLFAGWRPR